MSSSFQTPFEIDPFCIMKILERLCNNSYSQNFPDFQYDFVYLFIYLFKNVFIAMIRIQISNINKS